MALDPQTEEDVQFINDLVEDGRPVKAIGQLMKAIFEEFLDQGFTREEAVTLCACFGNIGSK